MRYHVRHDINSYIVSSVLAAVGGWFDAYFAGVALCSCFLGGFAAVGLFATTEPKGGDR